MIDLHCHVLPGVDDGPATVEAAIDLVRGARADGITTIAATPHVSWTHPAVDSTLIADAVRELQHRLDASEVDVRIVPGAEVAATRAVELADAELRKLTLGGGPWLLVECPTSPTLTPGFPAIAASLASRGHRLLLAHPERSPVFLRTPELLEEFVASGMLTQVTAGALSGLYGRTIRDFALRLLDRGLVHVVASDGHGGRRPARIAGELRGTQIGPELTSWLADDAPAALLAGESLPPRPESTSRVPRRRLFRNLRH